jgi:hypothetical protein
MTHTILVLRGRFKLSQKLQLCTRPIGELLQSGKFQRLHYVGTVTELAAVDVFVMLLLLVQLQSLNNTRGECAHVSVTFDERKCTLQLFHIDARQPLLGRVHIPVAAMRFSQ